MLCIFYMSKRNQPSSSKTAQTKVYDNMCYILSDTLQHKIAYNEHFLNFHFNYFIANLKNLIYILASDFFEKDNNYFFKARICVECRKVLDFKYVFIFFSKQIR